MRKFFLFMFILLLQTSWAELPQKHFPVDDFLRERVNFWKKIFSEVHSYEGFIHDDEKLNIIYSKVEFSGKSRRSKIRYVKAEKKKFQRMLSSIIKKRKENLNEEESELLEKIGDPDLVELRKMPRRVRFQQGMRDRYIEGLKRSYLYLDRIKAAFKEMGLPLELAYLPHVESSFNYLAYSKVGAAGIWQFMRSTGKIYKLRLNYVIDERRDPIKATFAAGRLLRDNYNKLGTWPLALTAYNHGARSMERAIRDVGTTDMSKIIQKYDGRRFGFASRNFYPSFVAAAELAQNPEPIFGDFEKEAFPEYTEIELKKPLTVDQIREDTNLSKSEFEKFNLAVRPTAYRNDLYLPKGFTIKVPTTDSDKVQSYIAAMDSIKTKPIDLKSGGEHIVSSGESLYLISRLYKASISDLITLNQLSSPSHITPGMRLKIPGENYKKYKARDLTLMAKVTTPKKQEIQQKELVKAEEELIRKEDIALAKDEPNTIAESENKDTETDSLWSRFTSYIKEKVSSEPTTDSTVIADSQSEEEVKGLSDQEESKINDQDIFKDYDFDVKKISDNVHEIMVEPEETIGHYCDWLVIRSSKIRSLNKKRSNWIKLGQRLRLPMTDEEVIKFNIKRIEYHTAIQEDFYNNFKVAGITQYKVRRGDSLLSISNKLEIPLWLIKKTWKSKGIKSTELKVGQTIDLPEVVEKNSEQS